MGVINRSGPSAADLIPPAPRSRTAFAAGHLPGTYGFQYSDSFVNYLGWLYA